VLLVSSGLSSSLVHPVMIAADKAKIKMRLFDSGFMFSEFWLVLFF
jgi:fatty acid-binding protein DegV